MADWRLLEEIDTSHSQSFTRRSAWFMGTEGFRNKRNPVRVLKALRLIQEEHCIEAVAIDRAQHAICSPGLLQAERAGRKRAQIVIYPKSIDH